MSVQYYIVAIVVAFIVVLQELHSLRTCQLLVNLEHCSLIQIHCHYIKKVTQ